MRTTTDELPPIVLGFVTTASPDAAWMALTDPARVAEWLTEVTPLGEVGDPYRLDFGEGSVVEGVIVAVEPGRRFSHTWRWLDGDPDQVTLVSWSIEPLEEAGTRIGLTHEGWSEAGAGTAVRDDHEGYWNGYLDDLAAVLAGTD